MGGGEQGAASGAQSTQTMQELLQGMQRQRTYDKIGGAVAQGFQQFGAGAGTQQPYMSQQRGGGFVPGQAQQPVQSPYLQGLGQLFAQQGPGAGIDEQQLAMILSRLGYGGGGGLGY